MTVRLITNLTEYFNDLCDVMRLFWGDIPISLSEGDTVFSHTELSDGDTYRDIWVCGDLSYEGVSIARKDSNMVFKRLRKRAAKKSLYELMKKLTGIVPPWGALTGIRPTRLLYEAIDAGMSKEDAAKRLMSEYDVSEDRAKLISDICDMQKGIRLVPENMCDLYIGIPFCTTRCAYCSFSSGEIGNGKLVEPYVESLLREIDCSARVLRQNGYSVRAAYMGGGTPTSISCSQLERILVKAMESFPEAIEWTVEAGRPDTIDREKLSMLKRMNVGRISVNPQTFNDETLKRVGRAHTGEDTIRAFNLAREVGFDDINMDVIAGLPDETISDFTATMEKILELSPESVTVHSLAIKRSSKLHEQMHLQGEVHARAIQYEAANMIEYARRALIDAGLKPYYIYRQKYMAGNLENVGYAKIGRACLYNIGNMEETVSVLALGAGAISKWLFDSRARIERAANVKNIEEYISRVDEMCKRKEVLISGGAL